MQKRDKQRKVFVALVNKQLEPHGVTYDKVKNDPEWYIRYKTTPEAEKDFITWGTNLIIKELRLSKKLAENEMSWFILQWGLTTNQSSTPSSEAPQPEVTSLELKNTKRSSK
jgi:hypothetical protein